MNAVETKAVAGGLGAGGGAVTAQFIDYLLNVFTYGRHDPPTVVQDFVLYGTTTLFALAASWLAPHTHVPAPVVAVDQPDPNNPGPVQAV